MSANQRFPVDSMMPAGLARVPYVYEAPFLLGDPVFIGGDTATSATVTGILWKAETPQIEVSWMHNGALSVVWVSPLVLQPADAEGR